MLETAPNKGQIIFTLAARCRDCHRCVRVCPVKAIRLEKGQAFVSSERCVACGTCVRECPQNAKMVRNDVEKARAVSARRPFAVSLAPAFAAAFEENEQRRLAAALRRLGAVYVAETSLGAGPVAQASAAAASVRAAVPSICTACPAVVNYVETYEPRMAPALLPVVSPMMAHARMIKERLRSDIPVIFIGPCVAKKKEAERPEFVGLVDIVLTFTELRQWLEKEGVHIADCEESDFDEQPTGLSRVFPLPGGLLKTAALAADGITTDILPVSGFSGIKAALDGAADAQEPLLIEPLFCPEGCVNGPGIGTDRNLFDRKRAVVRYAKQQTVKTLPPDAPCPVDLSARYAPKPTPWEDRTPTEEDLQRILEKTGKIDSTHRLDCGACGYDTCREKAVAVFQGMAEPEMCLPYMRRMAERRTDRIIETNPNGILVLDDRLRIISMNPAFRRFFLCGDPVLGKPISYLMDPAPFEKLTSGMVDNLETTVRHAPYNLVCHELFYALREENQYVGIFVDITRQTDGERRLEDIRQGAIAQAEELMTLQVKTAQQIARFLGESTARSEALLRKMTELAEDGRGSPT